MESGSAIAKCLSLILGGCYYCPSCYYYFTWSLWSTFY